MTSPKVSSAMETENNAFPTLLPPPLKDSVPREHQGALKPHIQPLTAQQAPVRRILFTWDFTLHSEIPARSRAASSHPEIKEQHASKPEPGRPRGQQHPGCEKRHPTRGCGGDTAFPGPDMGASSSQRLAQAVGCSRRSCTARQLLSAAGQGPGQARTWKMGLLEMASR